MENFLKNNWFYLWMGGGTLFFIFGFIAWGVPKTPEQMKQKTEMIESEISVSKPVNPLVMIAPIKTDEKEVKSSSQASYMVAKNHLIRISGDEQIIDKLTYDQDAISYWNLLPKNKKEVILQHHPELFRFNSPVCLNNYPSYQTICAKSFINEFMVGIHGKKSPLYIDLLFSLSNISDEIYKLLNFYANHPNQEAEYRKAARQMEKQVNLSDWYEFAMSIESGEEHLVQEVLNKNRDFLLNIPQLDKRLEKMKFFTNQKLREKNSLINMNEKEIFYYLEKEWENL